MRRTGGQAIVSELQRKQLRAVLDSMVQMILAAGGSEWTAYACAAEFAKGVLLSWDELDGFFPLSEVAKS